jgi:hypothetical protein
MTETETKWAERVRRWRASDKTASEFARGQGFEASTLRYWASRLNRLPEAVAKPAARVRVLRVRRVEREAAGEPMTVTVGAARIEVRAGFDRALLRELIAALAPEGAS